MPKIASYSFFVVIPLLSACGGSGTSGLPVINADQAVLSAGNETVSLTTNALSTTFALDPDFDRGPFTGASNLSAENEGQILAFSEGESTFAAFLLNREEGTTADSFFGRTVQTDSLPSGQATLNGTYVGAFVNETQDTLRSYIEGEATINIDLDEMAIGGGVTNMTSELFSSGLVFTLSEELDIIFPETQILPNGTFEGVGEHSATNDENGRVTDITTNWSGLLGGGTVDDLEVVGQVDTVSVTEGVNGASTVVQTSRQSGVFVVGHE